MLLKREEIKTFHYEFDFSFLVAQILNIQHLPRRALVRL